MKFIKQLSVAISLLFHWQLTEARWVEEREVNYVGNRTEQKNPPPQRNLKLIVTEHR